MIYQPSNSLIESLRNLFKQRVKDGRLAYLGDGTGVVAVAGRKGYLWARFPNGTDGVGNLAYSAPFQVRDTGAAHLGYEGASVYVAVRYNGEPEIVSSNYRELDNAGIDTRVLNPLEPQSKWVYPFQLVIALALAVGTKVTASTKVSVSKLIYYIANTFTEFETTPSDSSLIDLTSYIPTADNHLYAMLWLDPYTNAIEVTTSTTQSLFTPLDTTDLQECVTQRPPDGIPLKAFYLANAQSSVTQTSMDVDVRQFLNMPEPLGFPQTLTTKERVRPNRTVILPNYTTSGAGTITLGSGARISVYPHPNLSATANPTVNDDSGDGYSIGSLWVNTTNDTTWVCVDATLGAAVWRQTNISSAAFTVAGDSGTPQTITNGDTLTLDGTNDIVTAATATDTVTISGAGLVATAPATSSRNVIQGTSATVTGLTVKGATSQSADYFQVQNVSGTTQFVIDSAGFVGVGSAVDPIYPFQLQNTSTLTSGTMAGVYSDMGNTPASASSLNVYGLWGIGRTTGSQNHTGVVRGFLGSANHNSTGTLSNLQGGYAAAATGTSAGLVSSMVGSIGQLVVQSTLAKVTNGYIVRATTTVIGGSSLGVDNLYGVYVDAVTQGNVLNYAIYTNAGLVLFGGQVQNTAGSAGTPSMSFSGDTNSGLYSSAADEITMSLGGVARITTTTTTQIQKDGSGNTVNLLHTAGETVFNEQGASTNDVRIEGDTDANLFVTDASTDKVGIGTNAPTAKLDINSDVLRLRTAKTPSSASDTGNAGDICWDSDYIYVCVAANTWKRSTLASW